MIDPFNYKRRKSSTVYIGNTPLGSDYPIRIQSMTNTSTMDTDACVEQAIRIIDVGGEYVRLTAQGTREAENLANIRQKLRNKGYQTPLIADIHFNPRAADVAARHVEKVRINPGNFVDPVKKFENIEYTEEEYNQELKKIRDRFLPFLQVCKENNTAIRIGVNHGSLSDRIMSRYGDTPEGMVESCMEFLRICVSEGFLNVVLSIKASNTGIMVRTVRLLIHQMEKENMHFPIHLGVTEAGEGEDGRIKSAVGIGTLLIDGIGDTIRVSLSEDPEFEIPVAKFLRDYTKMRESQFPIHQKPAKEYNPFDPQKRLTTAVEIVGGNHVPVVIFKYDANQKLSSDQTPDFIYVGNQTQYQPPQNQKVIIDFNSYSSKEKEYPLFTWKEKESWLQFNGKAHFLQLNSNDYSAEIFSLLKQKPNSIILLYGDSLNRIGEKKAFIHTLMNEGISNPVILQESYSESLLTDLQIKSAVDTGSFLLDKLVQGVFLQNKNSAISQQDLISTSFSILQATGQRITKNEYISCPGCGRTLFNLQKAVKEVKKATLELKGLKIAVMGCIVNGPGEMADADFGYVGAGAGKISLYKGKECIKKNIPEEKALEELLDLIKNNPK